MYILHRVDYPERNAPVADVQNAWTGVGLPQPVPTFSGATASPQEVRKVIEDALRRSGATLSANDGSAEVPRSSLDALRKLEDFYHRVYPETRGSTARGHFQYEEVEWLGEF